MTSIPIVVDHGPAQGPRRLWGLLPPVSLVPTPSAYQRVVISDDRGFVLRSGMDGGHQKFGSVGQYALVDVTEYNLDFEFADRFTFPQGSVSVTVTVVARVQDAELAVESGATSLYWPVCDAVSEELQAAHHLVRQELDAINHPYEAGLAVEQGFRKHLLVGPLTLVPDWMTAQVVTTDVWVTPGNSHSDGRPDAPEVRVEARSARSGEDSGAQGVSTDSNVGYAEAHSGSETEVDVRSSSETATPRG